MKDAYVNKILVVRIIVLVGFFIQQKMKICLLLINKRI